MNTGWFFFILLIVMGFIDLILGFVFSHRRDSAVGAAPAADEAALRARRFTGRVMMVSALFFWALAYASATGMLNPDLALPIFAGASGS